MRIRRRAEFLHIQSTGTRHYGRFVTVMASNTSSPIGRVGFTITKKVGCAVVRNRFRRCLREWLRTHGWAPAGFDLVVLVKPGVCHADTALSAVILDLQKVLSHVVKSR